MSILEQSSCNSERGDQTRTGSRVLLVHSVCTTIGKVECFIYLHVVCKINFDLSRIS